MAPREVHVYVDVDDLERGITDPFGNGFDLIAFHGRGYDAIAS